MHFLWIFFFFFWCCHTVFINTRWDNGLPVTPVLFQLLGIFLVLKMYWNLDCTVNSFFLIWPLAFSNCFILQIHSWSKDLSECKNNKNNNDNINNISQATGIFPALMLPEITPSSHSNRKPGGKSWRGRIRKKEQKTKTEKVCFDREINTHFHEPPLNSTLCQVEAIGFLAFFSSQVLLSISNSSKSSVSEDSTPPPTTHIDKLSYGESRLASIDCHD